MKAMIYKETLNDKIHEPFNHKDTTVITVYFWGIPIYKSFVSRDISLG